jgi:molybdate transport system regulatory protein
LGIKLFIVKDGLIVAGEGLIEILEAVDRFGSIMAASKSLGINYKRVWLKISTSEERLGVRLLNRGLGRAGCTLTEEARSLIRSYHLLEEKVRGCVGDVQF